MVSFDASALLQSKIQDNTQQEGSVACFFFIFNFFFGSNAKKGAGLKFCS